MTSAYPITERQRVELKEQLRLMAFDMAQLVDDKQLQTIQMGLGKRERLTALLDGELDFHGENGAYASHDLHAFAAKFPPQLPRAFIRGLTQPGDIVLDPMMGSGTTVVEAIIAERYGIGLDIDPLALRLSSAKTKPLNADHLREAGFGIIDSAKTLLANKSVIEKELARRFDEPTRKFIDYWFAPNTQRELLALVIALENVTDAYIRRFFELTFSSIIVTKSGGVSRARDLAHSRPHLDPTKNPKNALDQFALRLRKNLISIARLKTNGTSAFPLVGDARCMPLPDSSIDLIVTSPPYANAIDYMRAHKFSLVWLGESTVNLSELRSRYIGSERVGQHKNTAFPPKPEAIIRRLSERDKSKAAILAKYLAEMGMVLCEMHRVLRNDAAAIVIVGTSVMRDIDVETHNCLAEIAATLGFDVVGVAKRTLDRNKRMMPARFGRRSDSMIEQRMHDEYVIGLLKP
ncbi:MAG: site-specific DNA-methyltransferase [Chloroflexi bacterium]|nr:site-specific DNA-methyltransferase [Chloroflexota bacterium]MCL5275867.1 site-specific DNA-methyltransferase [Chloroflexota bacterium]